MEEWGNGVCMEEWEYGGMEYVWRNGGVWQNGVRGMKVWRSEGMGSMYEWKYGNEEGGEGRN